MTYGQRVAIRLSVMIHTDINKMTDISVKLRNEASVLRFKNGSPKLKDVLRKKCKERLQKNREDFVDKLRNISKEEEVFDTIKDMIKEDLRTVYKSDVIKSGHNSQIRTDIEEESVGEELEWLMNKYDNIFDDDKCLVSMLDDLNKIICPICQKNSLELEASETVESVVTCKCGLVVPTKSDLCQIKENIMSYLDEHNDSCSIDPQFCVLNDVGENHVYLMCYMCSSFYMLL